MRMTFFARCILAAAALAAVAPNAVRAQSVRGRVVEAGTGAALTGVQVRLLPEATGVAAPQTVTDSAGAFYLAAPPGLYRVQAERLGFAAVVTDTLRLAGREAVDVVLRMAVQAVVLEPMVIVARVPDARHAATHDGFRARREDAHAVGGVRVVDYTDPEFQNSLNIEDILQKFVPDKGCRTLYWNGHVVLTPAMDSVRMSTPLVGILGVEFYRNEYEAPMELRDTNPALGNQVLMAEGGSARCSIVAVWTRDGVGGAAAPPEPAPQLPPTQRMGAALTFRAPAAGEAPGTLVGAVEANGAPAGLAVVELVGPNGERFGIARAAEDGTFRLDAPGPGRYVLRAVHDELGAATSEVFELAPGQAADVVLRLPGR